MLNQKENSEYWKTYYALHRERRKAQQRAYYQRNRNACLARSKSYYQENHEDRLQYHRDYHQAHRDRRLLKSKHYAQTHRVEHNNHTKESRARHRDTYREYIRQYYITHQDHIREYRRAHAESIKLTQRIITNRYRARRREVEASLTQEQWQAILQVYNNRCAYCGASAKLTQDHVIPVSLGGPYTIWNIVPACLSCNSKKGNNILRDEPAIRLMI